MPFSNAPQVVTSDDHCNGKASQAGLTPGRIRHACPQQILPSGRISDTYLNWDNVDDRRRLLRGPAALAEVLQLDQLRAQPRVAVLDELHKYTKWKALLKGFFDTYGE
jgi:hypothetical protein